MIEWGQATTLKFNRTGEYLASGLVTGGIAIFDCDTYGVLTTLHGHCRPIQSLSWSYSSQFLLSASRDWKCIVWDLATGKPFRTFNFATPVWSANFHPFNNKMFAVSLVDENARFVDFSNHNDNFGDNNSQSTEPFESKPKIVVIDTIMQKKEHLSFDSTSIADPGENDADPEQDDNDTKSKQKKKTKAKKKKSIKAGNVKQSVLTAIFDSTGDYIITGTSRGQINVIRSGTSSVIYSKDITTSKIKSIVLSASGRHLVANSSDRIVRLLALPDFKLLESQENASHNGDPNKTKAGLDEKEDVEIDIQDEDGLEIKVIQKFSDVVNRLQWNSVAISPSSEYILASTFENAHVIYMWETGIGSLVKIYEGPKEELVEVAWHPTRSLIAATGLESGKIHIWSSVPPQRWSALAPDFIEVEENVVYEEAEDEFDKLYEEADMNDNLQNEEEEENIDIFTEYGPPGSEIENDKKTFIIPISMDIEEDQESD